MNAEPIVQTASKTVAPGAVIRNARIRRHWSQQELGERAGGVAAGTVRRIELGQGVGHRSTLAAIALALGLEPEEIRHA